MSSSSRSTNSLTGLTRYHTHYHCLAGMLSPRGQPSLEDKIFGLGLMLVQSLYFLPHDATRSAVLLRQVVSLSVTLRCRDHIGWNTSKIISRLVSLGCLLFTDPNTTDLLQGEHPEILARIGEGYRKSGFWRTNISLARQDRTKVTIEVQ